MEAIQKLLNDVLNKEFVQAILSNPRKKDGVLKIKVRPVEMRGKRIYQLESFTKTQAFHENLETEQAAERILSYMEEFRQIVERNGVDFHTIAVELTESRNDTEYELVLDRVMQFKSLGVCTYLDDFGTGYSNFDRILSLKLDVVKFDRSLLLMANKDENSQFILNYFSTAFKKTRVQSTL